MRLLDNLLNRITMYRLALYYLIFLVGAAVALSYLKVLPYSPVALLLTTAVLIILCWVTNRVFAWAFQVPANVESVYITALILALIITPLVEFNDLWFIGWAAVLAMASKYLVAIQRKHLFNPAAFAVALTVLTLDLTASWWVGSAAMLPFVVIGGLLLVRKLRRFDGVVSFCLAVLVTAVVGTYFSGGELLPVLRSVVLSSPLLFFAFIILTEPLTAPPTRKLRIVYAILVGVLFAPQFHIGAFYATPEIAILVGNVFAYLVSPKTKLVLQLWDRLQLAPDVYEFVFRPTRAFAFEPGQYMEWTLPHHHPDSRGNRRFFTLASAPTERDIRLGVKFYPQSSTYKRSMLAMDETDEIVAAQIAGDFVLPKDPTQKCVFIAGGIGITPFRSMLKYLLDSRQQRPIVLFYSNKTARDIVYHDVLEQAQRQLGAKVVYTITDMIAIPATWNGQVGRITEGMIRQEVPDYKRCIFYVSGPNAMVDDVKVFLHRMHIPPEHIKADYFSGLA